MLEKLQFMTIMLVNDMKAKRDERGATATEYGLLVGLIALIIVVGVGLFGKNLNTFFSNLSTTVSGWNSN